MNLDASQQLLPPTHPPIIPPSLLPSLPPSLPFPSLPPSSLPHLDVVEVQALVVSDEANLFGRPLLLRGAAEDRQHVTSALYQP